MIPRDRPAPKAGRFTNFTACALFGVSKEDCIVQKLHSVKERWMAKSDQPKTMACL
jgi:hypothetical protein